MKKILIISFFKFFNFKISHNIFALIFVLQLYIICSFLLHNIIFNIFNLKKILNFNIDIDD